jgi:hypothetical protein
MLAVVVVVLIMVRLVVLVLTVGGLVVAMVHFHPQRGQ